VALIVAAAAAAVIWLVFHHPAGAVMTAVIGAGGAAQAHPNLLPSRWFYALAAALFAGGLGVVELAERPVGWLLIAAGCALGPTVLGSRLMHDPCDVTDDTREDDARTA
jgi:hypothetical protein